jgi:hypothetical protein
MPYSDFKYWVKYISILRAREQLREFEASAYPNMKRDDMKKVRDNYKKDAVPLELDDSEVLTTGELAKVFKGMNRGK